MAELTQCCPACGHAYSYKLNSEGHRRRRCSPNCLGDEHSARVTSKCRACGVAFGHYPSQPRIFCSKACRYGQTPKLAERECERCTREYRPTSARQRYCRQCSPDKTARTSLRRYGLTRQDIQDMHDRQNGLCAICAVVIPMQNTGVTSRPTCLDHDHETGQARGLLCRRCNMALHYVENVDWWQRAVAYLEASKNAQEKARRIA